MAPGIWIPRQALNWAESSVERLNMARIGLCGYLQGILAAH